MRRPSTRPRISSSSADWRLWPAETPTARGAGDLRGTRPAGPCAPALGRGSGGLLDTAWGNGGMVVTTYGSYGQIRDIVMNTDGSFYAAGDIGLTGNGITLGQEALLRYTRAGALDTSFNTTGAFPGVATVQTAS